MMGEALPAQPHDELIALDRCSVMRGAKLALDDVTLRLRAGESVVILGPNGCGKSTLMKLMTCELYPLAATGTRVSILGRERWDVSDLRRRMGVVWAEAASPAALRTTGLECVVTGFFGSAALWPHLAVTDAMRARAEQLIDQLALSALSGTKLAEMSAGQQKRVLIARALVGQGSGQPLQMLLLDEPSNALDIRAQRELRTMLGLVARQGTAVIMVTHHAADIIPEMERTVLMRAGRVVADGPTHELMTAAQLRAVFDADVRVERDGEYWSAR